MAVILRPGEILEVGERKYDETRRFELVLQTDGNLVLYAHFINSQPRRQALWDSKTYRLGSDVQVIMAEKGYLAVVHKSTNSLVWYRPRMVIGTTSRPWGIPGSTLHLQSDGNLVIYKPPAASGNDAMFNTGALPPQSLAVAAIPGALTLDISIGGRLESQFDKLLENKTGEWIGVTDGLVYRALEPSGQIGLSTGGSLIISADTYEFEPDGPGPGNSADAIPNKAFGPDHTAIQVTGSGARGYGLTGYALESE